MEYDYGDEYEGGYDDIDIITQGLGNVKFQEPEADVRDFDLPESESLRNRTGAELIDFILHHTTLKALMECLGLEYEPSYGYYNARRNRFGGYNGRMYGLQTPDYSNLRNSEAILTMKPEFPTLENVVRDYTNPCFGKKRSYKKKNMKPRRVAVRSMKRRRNTKC
jgi:hypothetical protein